MIKGTIRQEDMAIINVCTSNNTSPKYVRKIESIKGRNKQFHKYSVT